MRGGRRCDILLSSVARSGNPKDPRQGGSGPLRTVKVPAPFAPIFTAAQKYVSRYFQDRVENPEQGTISISGERYILVRAASMSVEFFDLVSSLYQDKGPEQARTLASNLLFETAHAIAHADPLANRIANSACGCATGTVDDSLIANSDRAAGC